MWKHIGLACIACSGLACSASASRGPVSTEAFAEAVVTADVSTVRAALERGVTPTELGYALDMTVAGGVHWPEEAELLVLLLSEGADPDVGASMPPIAFGAFLEHWATVHILAAYGADVDAQAEHDGNTALHWAAKRGSLRGVCVLLEWRADPDIRNKAGLTPAEMARAEGHAVVAELIEAGGRLPPEVDAAVARLRAEKGGAE